MQRCTVRDIMSFNVIAAYYLRHSLASLSKQMNKLCGQYTPASQRIQWWFDVVWQGYQCEQRQHSTLIRRRMRLEI